MEQEIYQILKKHKLSLKKREEILADLLLLLGVGGSFSSYEGINAVRCPKCNSTDIMMPMKGFHEKDKCLECGERF